MSDTKPMQVHSSQLDYYYLTGGWILVDDPAKYADCEVLTDGRRFAVWHRDIKDYGDE